ncbi:hypothetical protein CS379_16755 [Methylobacterium frigidaeris]|nr:hypothetical protein CS379_16755 [Methylobacterium frigidaeris]
MAARWCTTHRRRSCGRIRRFRRATARCEGAGPSSGFRPRTTSPSRLCPGPGGHDERDGTRFLDAASGDTRRGASTLGTFNPLRPNGDCVTRAGYTSCVNLLHLRPSLTVRPVPGLAVSAALGLQWRQTTPTRPACSRATRCRARAAVERRLRERCGRTTSSPPA